MRIAKSLIGSLALGLTLALGAAACGGGVGSATPTPSSTASLTSSTGQTPSPFTKVAATATLTAPMPSPETPPQSGELLDPGSAPPPQVPTPADIIDGGIIQDGPFIFYLWLFSFGILSSTRTRTSLLYIVTWTGLQRTCRGFIKALIRKVRYISLGVRSLNSTNLVWIRCSALARGEAVDWGYTCPAGRFRQGRVCWATA